MELAVVNYDPKRCSYYQFPNDYNYYQRNPHPSLEEMICISKEINIPYEQVFSRFSEIRLNRGERCMKNCACIKVFKYFYCSETFNGIVGHRNLKIMHEEFDFIGSMRHLPVENLHLIMQGTNLRETVINEEYAIWKKEKEANYNKYPIELTAGMKQFLRSKYEEDPLMSESEIRQLAGMTRLPAEQVECFFDSIHLDEVFEDSEEIESPGSVKMIGWYDSDKEGSLFLNPLNLAKVPKAKIIKQVNEENDESDEKLLSLLDSSPNEFPFDLEFFDKNRHPTVSQMIGISKKCNVSYEIVIKRFFELRMVLRETCKRNDPCKKIYQFLEEKKDVLLDEKNKKKLEDEFEKVRYIDRNQLTAQFHLIMDRNCLPSDFVQKKYNEWNQNRTARNRTKRYRNRQFLKSEFKKNSVLSRERAMDLAMRCGLKWPTIHRYFSALRKSQRLFWPTTNRPPYLMIS